LDRLALQVGDCANRDTKIDANLVAHEQLADSIVLRVDAGMYREVWVRRERLLDLRCVTHGRAADLDIDPLGIIMGTTEEEREATQEGVWNVHLGKVIGEQCGNESETLWGWWCGPRHRAWHCI